MRKALSLCFLLLVLGLAASAAVAAPASPAPEAPVPAGMVVPLGFLEAGTSCAAPAMSAAPAVSNPVTIPGLPAAELSSTTQGCCPKTCTDNAQCEALCGGEGTGECRWIGTCCSVCLCNL